MRSTILVKNVKKSEYAKSLPKIIYYTKYNSKLALKSLYIKINI